MLARPPYVEWMDAKVLLQRHKTPWTQAGEARVFF